MPVTFTVTGRISNWTALQCIHGETLIGLARDVGARRYRIYRNAHDSRGLLIVAELPDYEAAQALADAIHELFTPLFGDGAVGDTTWEPIAWDGLG